jgi:hypothetical protein
MQTSVNRYFLRGLGSPGDSQGFSQSLKPAVNEAWPFARKAIQRGCRYGRLPVYFGAAMMRRRTHNSTLEMTGC